MAKVFTQEGREKIKGQVVELVRQSGRETLRQLEAKTGQILSLFLMNSVDCVTKLSLAGIQEGYATDRCM